MFRRKKITNQSEISECIALGNRYIEDLKTITELEPQYPNTVIYESCVTSRTLVDYYCQNATALIHGLKTKKDDFSVEAKNKLESIVRQIEHYLPILDTVSEKFFDFNSCSSRK